MQREPLTYRGPFNGLNTTQKPRELSLAWATVCNNILIVEGCLRPRQRVLHYADAAPPSSGPIHFPEGTKILSITQRFPNPNDFQSGERIDLIAKVIEPNGSPAIMMHLGSLGAFVIPVATELSNLPATFVFVGDWLYVLDGSSPLYKIRGAVARTVGIRAPVEYVTGPVGDVEWLGIQEASFDAGIGAMVQYAITFYDPLTGVESNPLYSPVYDCNSDQGVRMRILPTPNQMPPFSGAERMRLYRRNLSESQIAYRLRREFFPPQLLDFTFQDDLAESAIGEDVSSAVTGPFAPSRNGLPPRATIGAVYRERFFYNDLDNASLVRYSALGIPDHVHPSDYKTVTGDEVQGVTGLAPFADQLMIGRVRAVHIESGVITRPTNETAAAGLEEPDTSDVLYKSKATTGPGQAAGGNGFVLAGKPQNLYYGNETGFYRWDGVSEFKLTEFIKPTWLEFLRDNGGSELHPNLTYAVDAFNSVIYIHNRPTFDAGSRIVLVYHYGAMVGNTGIGKWTRLRFADPEVEGEVSCIATCFGVPDNPQAMSESDRYSPLLLGTMTGRLYKGQNPTQGGFAAGATPDFRYDTGRLVFSEGGETHFYFMRWLNTPIGDTLPVGSGPPLVDIGFSIDDGAESFQSRDIATHNFISRRMGRQGADVRFIFKKSAAWQTGWSTRIGIIGLVVDFEEIGQR